MRTFSSAIADAWRRRRRLSTPLPPTLELHRAQAGGSAGLSATPAIGILAFAFGAIIMPSRVSPALISIALQPISRRPSTTGVADISISHSARFFPVDAPSSSFYSDTSYNYLRYRRRVSSIFPGGRYFLEFVAATMTPGFAIFLTRYAGATGAPPISRDENRAY